MATMKDGLAAGDMRMAAISSSERMLVMHWDSALALSHFVQWVWSDLTCALTRGDIAEVVDAGVRDRLDGVGPDGVHEALEDVRGAETADSSPGRQLSTW